MKLTDRQKGWAILIAVAVGAIVLDQVTKVWAETSLREGKPCEVSPQPPSGYGCVTVIEGMFNLQYARNPGAAFSIFAGLGAGARLAIFLVITIVAVVAMIHLYRKMEERRPLYEWALGLLIGGALGNLIDRIRLDVEVIDFIQMFVGKTAWPTYNIADAAIVIGIGLVLIDALRNRRETLAEVRKGRRGRAGKG